MAKVFHLPAMSRGKSVTQAEFDWLLWFFQNADFGPADGDVRQMLVDQYEKATGNTVPQDYKSEDE